MGKLREEPFKLYYGLSDEGGGTIVRFTKDGYLGIHISPGKTGTDTLVRASPTGPEYLELTSGMAATLWVEVVDSWAKDGNWGGYLKVACAHQKGKYIDSESGWLHVYSSKYDKVTFVDKGDYYEIWQRDYETGRPLGVEDGILRFMDDKSKAGKWNIKD
ncbi:hypothetical protein IAE37_004678 [Pseudomonas sp. S31]|uniref:hypothetical protein n=1 Tax=Pseudomonas sp. S31 TaxID=1564473 RepID=UPI00191469F2|nr:hypothetical protein [Pseudomonas sp. S31]MBK5002402.1 hypothetical protein [Pseudomonas sp. S31]